MKPVILALLVVLVVSHSEALRCYCGGKKYCTSSVETCYGGDMVCASIMFTGPSPGYAQGCYSSHNCQLMTNSPVTSGYCCRTDLCNR